MFSNEDLQNHLETSSTIKTQSAVIAEWNMNIAGNISTIGNYRYRPKSVTNDYTAIPNNFDLYDNGYFYTNATDADVIVDGAIDDDGTPLSFVSKNKKNNLLYSLEDCFKPFRPRSGINKARYLQEKYLHHPNMNMAKRPRYYMSDKKDKFKYWSSYKTETLYKHTNSNDEEFYNANPTSIDLDGSIKNGQIYSNSEYGISKTVGSQNYIYDACPFIVYKDEIPTNRIVVKMQTHVGTWDFGTFSNSSKTFTDPFFGNSKSQTPSKWKVQVLKNNNWVDAISFNQSSLRKDGTEIVKPDGYVELSYGFVVPDEYQDIFVFAEKLPNATLLPAESINGYAYLVEGTDSGTMYVWLDSISDYVSFRPKYEWQLFEETVDRLTNFVTDFTNPSAYTSNIDGTLKYREFEYISGIRIVVDTMQNSNSIFDLIEISPRLAADISSIVTDIAISKPASDLGNAGLPVSQLLASTGTLQLFDYDNSFNANNTYSIISKYLNRHIQIKIYDIIVNVKGYDYYIPIKTMYSENFPQSDLTNKKVSITLKDLYFYFDSITAPEILMTNVSTSSAVSLLLDSIGFSNYSFKRVDGESEVIIPFFFIAPDKTVAQILQDIAISTQTAMFFDEYNNFIMMSKQYMMPDSTERTTDLTLYGTLDFEKSGVEKNKTTAPKLSNIISITSEDNVVYNDGKINYTPRYIQRSYGSIKQASMIDQDKTWIYKPVLLWEVSGSENTKSINNQIGNQSEYVLSAIPLNSDLSDSVPLVSGNQIVNNTFNLGEAVYWITRYNGYFYSSGEIIKYDAVEFNITGFGDVWINNVQEYQNYFSQIPFNGKIYPTGRVRIYCEPNYEEVDGILRLKNGAVAKHGRGQFGTEIAYHSAGINSYWSDNANVRGCTMQSKYLFNTDLTAPSTSLGAAGINNALAQKTTRTGIIRNFLSSSFPSESEINNMLSTQTGTIQSSALILNGPSFTTTESPLDFISYVKKPLNNLYKHFGTRMRIVGKVENNLSRSQTANGSTVYYTVPGTTPDKSISISGGSGGLAFMLDPETNNGYYFEIMALGTTDPSTLKNVNNIMFYKIKKDSASSTAIPVKLWESIGKIIVDNGKFTGQYRMVAEENPTVYDLAVEYQDIGNIRRFYLYINGTLLATVDDSDPLPKYTNIAPFVRGSARCMFENLYALTNNYSQNTSSPLDTPVESIFDNDEIDTNESFKKYAMSGIIQGTYLSGIDASQPPKYDLYFEEFGSIMREAALFNIKYDKAYPALYAKLSPTFNRIKGYSVAGFRAGSYGAEFLIFNATDTALSLDASSGNYLRIQGITFTQENPNTLTVDDYFSKNSDLSNPEFRGDVLVSSPVKVKKDYEDIRFSRLTYGSKDFTIDTSYIQDQDSANSLMSWVVNRVTKPRKSIGLKVFGGSTVQLGDIIEIKYKENNIDMLGTEDKRFVVYNISYNKNASGPDIELFLSEVSS